MVLSIVSPWGKDHEDTRLNRTYEALWSILRTFLKSAPVKTVLDFGCGDGSYSFLIRKWAFKLPKLMLCSPPFTQKNHPLDGCSEQMRRGDGRERWRGRCRQWYHDER